MSMPDAGPSRSEPTEDQSHIGQAAIRLREIILKGDFQAGERILEIPIARTLGMSRTPVRLALERLALEGLLEPYPSGGFIVREFTVEDVWDAIETRGTLEGVTARLASERWTRDSDLDVLRQNLEEMEAMGVPSVKRLPAYMELNNAFHAEIVRMAKSPMLRFILDRLFAHPFASPSVNVTTPIRVPDSESIFRTANDHHRLLIDAIASRRGSFAEKLAREHAELAGRILKLAIVEDSHVWAKIPGGPLINMASGDEL